MRDFFEDNSTAILITVTWLAIFTGALLGAKIGGDIHDAYACGCDVGWVTMEAPGK